MREKLSLAEPARQQDEWMGSVQGVGAPGAAIGSISESQRSGPHSPDAVSHGGAASPSSPEMVRGQRAADTPTELGVVDDPTGLDGAAMGTVDLQRVAAGHPHSPLDPVQAAARTLRDATKDKSYRAYPIGQEIGGYLRWKRGRLTQQSYEVYESSLDKLARHFCDLELRDFEPPVGTERLDEFMDERWGAAAPSTYNLNLSVLSDFCKWGVIKGKLHGDPTLPMLRHKKRDVHRETFSDSNSKLIIVEGPDPEHLHRDRCLLRLLLVYGIRKGALRNVKFKHFDHARKRLTIFTKGAKVRELPIVEPEFWDDLGRAILDEEAEPDHFLLPLSRTLFRGYDRETGDAKMLRLYYPERQIGDTGCHNWWYTCLERAGVVAKGVRSGEKMHKSRHTAGQRVLDATQNLKATQQLLGHASIQTTADTYTSWDIDQLAETMKVVTGDDS